MAALSRLMLPEPFGVVRFGTSDGHLRVRAQELLLAKKSLENRKTRFTHKHGNLEQSLTVPSRVQNLIWGLFRVIDST